MNSASKPVNLREVIVRLEHMLDAECRLFKSYIQLLDEERAYVNPLEAEKLSQSALKREELHKRIKEAELERIEFVSRLSPSSRNMRLSDFVKENFSPLDSKKLLLKVEELKELVRKCHSSSSDFARKVQFSLNLVSGLISIFWSATQNIMRSYTASGCVKESYHPAGNRYSGLLKQA